MSGGKHKKRGATVDKFCATAGTPCECGNNYRTVCIPANKTYALFTFPQVRREKTRTIAIPIPWNAHHIMCVASVTTNIIGADKIEAILKATVWCINAKRNMLALPLWGHYVRWYCKITAGERALKRRVTPPPFSNWPAHDFDHGSKAYLKEINDKCIEIARAAKMKAKKHDIDSADLKGMLDAASSEFRGKLRARGKRGGGTHKSWDSGMKSGGGNAWCKAFSMADNGFVTSKAFPMREFDAQTEKLMKAIQAAVKIGG